ncbi:NAD(P)H-dependent flavin oxidoreductase [Lysinibacillus sp. NPDC097279]|uniref:NAD(P)H-dependent flavin oxidoreductase n=1 Tax=Lysinibacillus sp. NPDC097279 TaxID=3364143 RepID=UPI003813B8A5
MEIQLSNRVQEVLGIQYPIVQAAMNWITDANFVASVSNAGGMGVIGPNAGPVEDTDLSSTGKLRNEIRKIKDLTDKPFALNTFFPPDGDVETENYSLKLLNVAFEEGVKYFVAVGSINKRLIKAIKNQGAILIVRELTPTVEGAKLAESLGADILIATGYDEGGWIPQKAIGTFSIVSTIVDAVNIPVLATGGINDIRAVRAAFALGAEGVYVGTRFIVSEECPAADETKQDIIKSTGTDLILVSNTQRSTPNHFAKTLEKMRQNGSTSDEIDSLIAQSGGLLPGMRKGNSHEGIVSVNTAIDRIKEIKSVQQIVDELMKDFK